MLYLRSVCALLCTLLAAATVHVPNFKEFVAKFKKTYEPGTLEWTEHERLYQLEAKRVMEHNELYHAGRVSYFLEINQFSDWSVSQKQTSFGYAGAQHAFAARPDRIHTPGMLNVQIPNSKNWVEEGITTPVKNQGKCGSCWAFTTTEMAESYLARDTGILTELAVEQIVDCVENPNQCGGSGGCEGATANLGFEYLSQTGFIAEWAYPYVQYWNSLTGKTYECRYDEIKALQPSIVIAQMEGYVKVQNNSYDAMMEAIAQGPVAINVDASEWHSYAGGVFDGCSTDNIDLNHAVQLVGYGTDENGVDYWLVRNSWGPYWGEEGFIRLRRQNPNKGETVPCGYDNSPLDGTECTGGETSIYVCGTCGLLWDASYPTGVHKF